MLKCVRVDDRDEASARSLEEDGWRFIERLYILECTTRPAAVSEYIVRMPEDDIEEVVRLARDNMGPNRYVRDGLLDPGVAATIRETWVRDNPDNIYVFKVEDRIWGFLLERDAKLDLVAVELIHRNKGVGRQLTGAFLGRAWRKGFSKVTAGTQSDNLPALAMYEALGFKIVGCVKTYHKGE